MIDFGATRLFKECKQHDAKDKKISFIRHHKNWEQINIFSKKTKLFTMSLINHHTMYLHLTDEISAGQEDGKSPESLPKAH